MRIRSLGVRLVVSAGLAAMAVGAADAASLREQQSNAAWHKQDVCAHDAFVKFPDYTTEANAKRAQATRACERKNHVLQRAPSTTSPVRRIPDAAAE
ncbi:MAG TPA: hypothetical protein VH020_08115 [Stellaceae bacterium]|jgi:hypothetical protein|nr:hypothetical protein [Stellaceae bacterium]